MKRHLAYVLLFVVIYGCKAKSEVSTKATVVNNCLLQPDKGVNGIECGVSNFADVKKIFGATQMQKKWIEGLELEIFGHYEYYLFYEGVGEFWSNNGRKDNAVIYKIILDSNSQCITEEGLGMGTTLEDWVTTYKSEKMQIVDIPNGVSIYNDSVNKEFLKISSSSDIYCLKLIEFKRKLPKKELKRIKKERSSLR